MASNADQTTDQNLLRPTMYLTQDALNLSPSQAATTTYEPSMTGENSNDRASRISMFTYASGEAGQYTKEEQGRLYNVLNSAYFLPSDEGEWNRLNKQHMAMVLGLGGLYPDRKTVQAILRPEPGVTKKILDLGCGSGVWAIDMAKEFPDAEVIGVDLAPVPVDQDALPPNCSFEIDNINLGLAHYYDTFDVVNCRIIGAGLTDGRVSKLEVQRCLKPGGVLIWMDVDYDMLKSDRTEYAERATDRRPGGSWAARMAHEMTHAALSIGKNNVKKMGDILGEGFWEDPLIDPKTCHTGSLFLPVGPFVSDRNLMTRQRLSYIGTLMRQDVSHSLWTFLPALKKMGMREELLKTWCTKADLEMNSLSYPLWSRWMLAWGRRRAISSTGEPLAEAPPLALDTTPTASDERYELGPYPYLFVYDTKEAAKVAEDDRIRRREAIPEI